MTELLRKAVAQLLEDPDSSRFYRANLSSGDDQSYQDALKKVTGKQSTSDSADKGHFGGRQITFKQDVYKVPERPAGDHTQPVGLLTQTDLQNYVLFRKDDRVSFQYKAGTSGASEYSYRKNGTDAFITDIPFSDQIIQELIDEGACELV